MRQRRAVLTDKQREQILQREDKISMSGPVWPVRQPDHFFALLYKATPNKFPVSRPELMENSMRAGGSFPLFHYFLNGSETS